MALLSPSISSFMNLSFPSTETKSFGFYYVTAKKRKLRISCSSVEASSENSSDNSSDNVVESTKGFTSLISASNVEKALRGIAITDADYYATLGITRGTSYDQVEVAYKIKSDELMNKGLDAEELDKELEMLKEAYLVLSSEEERRLYDWSLARNSRSDRYVWPFEVDITQTPTQTPPPLEPEDVQPTRLVGYFLLGWLMLSFVFSIAFNR